MKNDKRRPERRENPEVTNSNKGQPQSGNAGELHQVADSEHDPLTTNQGTKISDNQNSLMVEVRDLFAKDEIFQKDRATRAGRQ